MKEKGRKPQAETGHQILRDTTQIVQMSPCIDPNMIYHHSSAVNTFLWKYGMFSVTFHQIVLGLNRWDIGILLTPLRRANCLKSHVYSKCVPTVMHILYTH